MIKLVIFDIDGVLADSTKLHFETTREALAKFGYKNYTIEEDLALGTIPTRQKLFKLSEQGKISELDISNIWTYKGVLTSSRFDKEIAISPQIPILFEKLKEKGINIAIATNARRDYLDMILDKIGRENVDYALSSTETGKPKPNPECYLTHMMFFGVSPKETVIVEDSFHGKTAAWLSGAHVYPVRDAFHWSFRELLGFINRLDRKPLIVPHISQDINVVVPMAGLGSRFPKEIWKHPKPFIDVDGKPMIKRVVENINVEARHIFIVRKEHMENDYYRYVVNNLVPDYKIVEVDRTTSGAASTVLLAETYISSKELLIVNSDNMIDWNAAEVINSFKGHNAGLVCFEETDLDNKWSYVAVDSENRIREVREKKVISNYATTGHYWFKSGHDFIKAANKMIEVNDRTNNEFYVAPIFNYLKNGKGTIFKIEKERFWGLGTPKELEFFLRNYRE